MGKIACYVKRESTATLGQLNLADGWAWATEHILALTSLRTGNDRSLPSYTASTGGNHCSHSQCSAHCGLEKKGLGQAAWPLSVKNKTGIFSSTVIYYQCLKNPKQSQLFYICMMGSIIVFLPQFIKALLGKPILEIEEEFWN